MNKKNSIIRNLSNLRVAIYVGLLLLAISCKNNSYSTHKPKDTQTQQKKLQQEASPKTSYTLQTMQPPQKMGSKMSKKYHKRYHKIA